MHRDHAIKIAAIYGLLGCALVLAATSRYGIGLSSDSVTYLAAARNIAEGRGYVNFTGSPILAFPPLFSTLIAVLSAGLWDPTDVARFINAVCFGLVVFLTACWSFQHLRSSAFAWLGSTSILFSAALIGPSMYAWSEPLFLVLTLLMLLQVGRAGPADPPAAWILAGIFAGLAVLTRYAGIILVLTGAILLAAKRAQSIASRARRLFLFLSVAMLPIGLWFHRNYELSSTLTGYRAESARTLIQTGYDMVNVLWLWFLPRSVPFLSRSSLMILLVLLFGSIVFAAFRMKIAVVDMKEITPFLLFTILYALFMIYTTSKTALSPIDDRYMSPIFAPLVLSLFYLSDRLIFNYSLKTGHTWPRAILAASILIWLMYPVSTTYRAVKAALEEGAGGFHTAYWAESDLIAYLKSSELSGTIYTNEPSAVYALTGRVYHPSPEKFAYESDEPTDDLLRFEADLQSRGVLYIVWFHTDWWKGYLYDIDELQNVCDLERIVTLQDGAIYRMRLSHCRGPG